MNIKGKSRQSKVGIILVAVIEILLSFAASNSLLVGMRSPLSVAILGISGINSVWCYIASFVGYFLSGSMSECILHFASLTLLVGLRVILMLDGKKETPVISAVITGVAMSVSLVLVSIFYTVKIFDAVFWICSAVLCSALVYMVLSVSKRTSVNGILDINGIHGATLGILYVSFVTVVASISGMGLNLGRIFGVCVILSAAKKYRHIGGAVCGALTTCGIFLSFPELSSNTMLLATSGLICGAFSTGGTFVTVMVFLISTIAGLAVGYINSDTFAMLRDVAVGSVMFSCIPDKVVSRVSEIVGGEANAVSIVGHAASSRLSFASNTLSSIRTQLGEISDTIKNRTKKRDVQEIVGNDICVNCKRYKECWHNCENCENTVNGFTALEHLLDTKGYVSVTDVIDNLPSCKNVSAVAGSYNRIYKEKLYDYSNNLRVGELREIVTQQLCAMEDMLCDLSHRINQMSFVDPSLSERVRLAADKLGAKNSKACVFCDENKNYKAEVFFPSTVKLDILKLTIAVGEILGAEMELPKMSSTEAVAKLLFSPKPEYEIRLGYWQSSAHKDVYSGDTIEVVPLSSSEEYIVLSDGMGTGKRAKLDSMLASSLIGKLIKTGISCETAVRMINSILRVKGWEESFATLDVARFDLYRGVCDFVKAGAASSYIIRDGVVSAVTLDTLPLGILSETEISSHRQKLFDGDIIIIASDGISDYAERVIASIAENETLSCDEIAKNLGSTFFDLAKQGHRDDISIIVIKVLYTPV